MPQLIHVHGLASQKAVASFEVTDLTTNLMEFLRHRGIPIASSCGGDGVCRKCVVNDDLMSCQLSVGAFLVLHPEGVIKVGYL